MGLLKGYKQKKTARDLDLTGIVGQIFRVTTFDPEGSTWDSEYKPKSPDGGRSYGHLMAEPADKKVSQIIPITHQDDFAMIARVFLNEQAMYEVSKYEILVTYFPKPDYKGAASKAPHNLHLAAVPRKTLEQYYIIAEATHKPLSLEKIFGPFVWTGIIEMQFNPKPFAGN
jgi:hypothetical protein